MIGGMIGQPPTLDYQKPADHAAERRAIPVPRLRWRWILLCWLPPATAVWVSVLIGGYYGSVALTPRVLYNTQQWLLFVGFWWVAIASLIRLLRVIVRSR
jgi:hypothetical protein